MAATQSHISIGLRARIDIDTLYHILSHLTPEPEGINGPTLDSECALKAVARLARVHSSFTPPVLAVVWGSLPSQKPLEHLLCVVGIAQRRTPNPRSSVEMCGTPSTHALGWKRFQEYAALVHEIIVYPYARRRWDAVGPQTNLLREDTFWCQLSAAFSGSASILPHLKRATVRSKDFDNLPIDMGVLRLLNPSAQDLHELHVTLPRMCQEGSRQLNRALEGSFSSNKTLIVLEQFLDPEDVKLLPSSHPHLRNLEVHPHGASFKLDDLRPLAALTRLESLAFSMSPREPPEHHITFKELRSLKLYCYGFDALDLLLTHVDAPQLQGFSISESHRDFFTMSKELPGHLHTLLAKYPSLTAFEWDSSGDSQLKTGYLGSQRANAPLADLVAPLLSHRAMQSFTVRLDGPLVPYTPADFHAFAKAWPDLKTFLLYNSDDSVWKGVQQRADVESVVAFARHCPNLRSLSISRVVQLESDPSIDSVKLPVAPHCLQELCVYSDQLPVGESLEASSRSEFVVQFRDLVKKVFPYAVHRIRE